MTQIETEDSAREVPEARDAELAVASFAQERMWFLEQFMPGGYAIVHGLRVTGNLDVARLNRALNQVIERHEALRTTFIYDNELLQVIHPRLAVTLEVVDESAVVSFEDAVTHRLRTLATTPFDLSAGPLVRMQVLRLASGEQALLLAVHHIVADGWSMGVFARDLLLCYFASDANVEVPETPIQYADYAAWQREVLTETLDVQLAYWRAQLGDSPALELPTDRPRPRVKMGAGARVVVELQPEIVSAVSRLSQENAATPFMVVLAAFQLLLARYSGQQDIVVGTPIANRRRSELESIIGLFVNTLALRTRMSLRWSFRELLSEVKRVCLDAYSHQDAPFERVVEATGHARDMTRTALFQVMFVLQNAPRDTMSVDGLSFEPLEFDSGTSEFDLALSLTETDDGRLRGDLAYDTALFDADTIERLWQSLDVLLRDALRRPDEPVASLRILDSEHQTLVTDTFAVGASASLPQRFAHQRFSEHAASRPNALALVTYDGERLSYGELEAKSNQLASYLIDGGVSRGDIVGLYLEPSLDRVVALLAVLKTGGTALPLDPDYPEDRLRFMLERTGAACVLIHRSRHLATSARLIDIDIESAIISRFETHPVQVDLAGADAAYITFTSGSTGEPKGAVNTHGGLENLLAALARRYESRSSDVHLHKYPFGVDAVVSELLLPLATGARIVVARPGGHRDSEHLVDLVDEHDVTLVDLVPTALAALMETIEDGVPRGRSLRHIISGGEALTPALARRCMTGLDATLHNTYGPCETTIEVSHDVCDVARTISVGRPLDNSRIYLLDAWLQPVPIGVVGELHIGGMAVGAGYVNRPKQTAERFIPDPFGNAGRLYASGDLGH